MTLVETGEPAHALCINGDGAVMQFRRAACQTRMVGIVGTQDAPVVSSAARFAFRRDGSRVDDIRCASGFRPLVAGGQR